MNNEIDIDAGEVVLKGFLEVPDTATGLVVFAHGSGSSRFSRRNNAVAAYLRDARLGTLLFDLLTPDEERVDAITREHRFDIPLLSARLSAVVGWLGERTETSAMPAGLFGSSTGAAAALITAATMPGRVGAVVSRGGRVDLAGAHLGDVDAPTLMIVGGADLQVLELNREAQALMKCESRIAIVDNATHLFEEPGALEQVSRLARDWFVKHLSAAGA
jgi:pimeloyl-ACP methyl ester carboxylesterase